MFHSIHPLPPVLGFPTLAWLTIDEIGRFHWELGISLHASDMERIQDSQFTVTQGSYPNRLECKRKLLKTYN